MDMHLNGKMFASAALATAAIATATLGAVAIARKKRAHAQLSTRGEEDADLASYIGPGEINPYADTATDPANQN